MATIGNWTKSYSGRPAFFISFTVDRYAVSGTKARWRGRLAARNPNGSTLTYALSQFPWKISIEGQSGSGTHNLDFRSGATTIQLGEFITGWIEQGSGTPTIDVSASHTTSSVFGSASVSGSFVADRLASPPGKSSTPSISAIDTDQATYSWSATPNGGAAITDYGVYASEVSNFATHAFQQYIGTALSYRLPAGTLKPATNYWGRIRAMNIAGVGAYSDSRAFHTTPVAPSNFKVGNPSYTSMPVTWARGSNGNALTGYEVQYAKDPSFSGAMSFTTGVTTSATVPNLTPNTDYSVRVRAIAGSDKSPWSTAIRKKTSSLAAPTLTVTPSLDGTSADVVVTRPSGVSSVDKYVVEYRPTGGNTSSRTSTVSSFSVSSLISGTAYQWRAAVAIGNYQSPWTGWKSVVQPNPNTEPGDFFDGSTPAKTDVTYAWAGAAGSSISYANGVQPLGWGTFASGGSAAGVGTVSRVSGGRAGAFAARVAFHTDAKSAGFHAGTVSTGSFAAWTESGAQHDALIYVRLPFRSQRLAAMLQWMNSSGVEVGRSVGDAQLVYSSGSEWTGLRTFGIAPEGATSVGVRVIDVEGPGWSLWRSGDAMLLDNAITPFGDYYFDGSTLDTYQYDYRWEGVAHRSPSRRHPTLAEAPDLLVDPDCAPVPKPPRPPFIDDSCVEEDTFEWRRIYTSLGDGENAGEIPEWVDAVPTVTLRASTDLRLVRLRYYQNPFSRPLTSLDVGEFCAEQVITFIPDGAILTIDGVSERAWAEVGSSATVLDADHLLAVQQGDVPQWASLTCGVPYYLTVDVPVDSPPDALSVSVELTVRYRQ